MIHPSYTELIDNINSRECGPGDEPVVKSRYSLVIASSKRARQIVDGAAPLVNDSNRKALSIAVDELYAGEVNIVSASELEEEFTEEEVFEAAESEDQVTEEA